MPRTTTTTVRHPAALVTVLVLSGLVIGMPAPVSATAPSRDTYIDKADAICARTTAKVDAVVEDLGFSPSDDEARDAVDEIVLLARKEIRSLRALAVPKGDARKVDKVYDAVEEAVERIDADPGSIVAEPGPYSRATKLAEAYGFEECGRG
jgi:hypothetical protein